MLSFTMGSSLDFVLILVMPIFVFKLVTIKGTFDILSHGFCCLNYVLFSNSLSRHKSFLNLDVIVLFMTPLLWSNLLIYSPMIYIGHMSYLFEPFLSCR
jgi:hypothetical protein